LNYIVRLGWAKDEIEKFTMNELIDFFNLSDVNSSPSKFSLQLLDWYNNAYLKELDSSTLLKLLREIGSDINENFKNIHNIINVLKVGAKSLKEIEENFDMFLKSPSIDNSN
jgi:glutamyl-tRNA synthetase